MLPSLASFLAFLLVGAAQVKAAGNRIKGWNIDESCDDYRGSIRNAIQGAADLAYDAYNDLEVVRKVRDDSRIANWNRVARHMTAWYNFTLEPDRANDEEVEPFWETIYLVMNAMEDAFDDDNADGVPAYTDLPDGPTIMCDSSQWEWYDLDDNDPTVLLPFPGTIRENRMEQMNWDDDIIGAWYWNGRFLGETEELKTDTMSGCANARTAATTYTELDFIIICWNTNPQSEIVLEESLPDDVESLNDLAENYLDSLLYHEMVHWFSATQSDPKDMAVIDTDCIDDTGTLAWLFVNNDDSGSDGGSPDDEVYITQGEYDQLTADEQAEYIHPSAYRYYCCTNLANFHPEEAVFNAENYLLFALASKYKGYDWSGNTPISLT